MFLSPGLPNICCMIRGSHMVVDFQELATGWMLCFKDLQNTAGALFSEG